jgi:hypothetical protein
MEIVDDFRRMYMELVMAYTGHMRTMETSATEDKLPSQQQRNCIINKQSQCPITSDSKFVLITSLN